MNETANRKRFPVSWQFFETARPRLLKLAGRLVDDPDAAVSDAEQNFEDMLPGMAYTDKPEHPFAAALFIPCINLSIYLALKKRGVDVHDFGVSLLNGLALAPSPKPAGEATSPEERVSKLVALGEESQRNAAPGEDVFEAFAGDGESFDFGINIQSCAICHHFANYDAMDLVPYMCAADDLVSEKQATGLSRTGTIALGASQCDFRYRTGGEPKPIAPQFPEKIRWKRDTI